MCWLARPGHEALQIGHLLDRRFPVDPVGHRTASVSHAPNHAGIARASHAAQVCLTMGKEEKRAVIRKIGGGKRVTSLEVR